MKAIYIVILFYLLTSSATAQVNVLREGNIIRININNGHVIQLDELTWEHTSNYYGSNFYTEAFSTDSNAYLIRSKSLFPDESPGPFTYTAEQEFLVNTNTKVSKLFLGIENYIYFWGFTYYSPYIYRVNSGCWLFYDFLGRAFISNTDSLTTFFEDFFTENRIIHIPGQIDSFYVIALFDLETESATYFLDDLEEAPDYDMGGLKKVNTKDEDIVISGIAHLFDSLYVMTTNYDYDPIFHLAMYSNNTLSRLSGLNVGDFEKWKYKNEGLYIFSDDNLYKYDFSAEDTSFINKRVIIAGEMDINFDQMLSIKFKGDSITIYDIENEKTLNTLALDSLTIYKRLKPLIDYPYVYLHQQTSVTSIEQQPIIPEGIQISAYPNPFNNSITFRIDKSEQYIENVTIYNVAGQIVFERVFDASDRIRRANWHADDASSGIYFTRIQTNRTTETKKIILLK